MKLRKYAIPALIVVVAIATPCIGFCSVESSLSAIQSRLIEQILPLAAILGRRPRGERRRQPEQAWYRIGGTIVAVDAGAGTFTVEVDGKEHALPHRDLDRANLQIDPFKREAKTSDAKHRQGR